MRITASVALYVGIGIGVLLVGYFSGVGGYFLAHMWVLGKIAGVI